MLARASQTKESPVIVWFRDDLRLADHPALQAAVETGRPLICVYVLDDETPALHRLGAASRWWLHGALAELRKSLAQHHGALLTLHGSAETLIPALAKETDANCVFWHHRFHAKEREQDDRIADALSQNGVSVTAEWGTVLLDPERVRTKEEKFYRVFTAFWKAFQLQDVPDPIDAPSHLSFYTVESELLSDHRLDEQALLPTQPDWAAGLRSHWEPGETEGQEHLEDFLKHDCTRYGTGRDELGREGTSRLSPYLASGAVSPRQVWAAIQRKGASEEGARIFLSEIGWREFAKYTLFHQPLLPETSLNQKFSSMSWRSSQTDLEAWQQGRTGIPVVDAGMRQLWVTGWMHNRARMIVGSFLTKHLLIDWREGEAWFRDTLVDADWASNAMNWQWVAGTGIDAAPFFRIFNPTRQGVKFDPDGDYIRQWVPELKKLSGKALLEPWNAREDELRHASVILGKTYPRPIVELQDGRDRAMKAFRSL
ncbi:deoxyribodipyrimidine photo-lyase [Gluconobacter sp. GP1]|uniref:cryptochrome/photolyase family protein n=1 Tax=Gluconobacter sp. GP1 TaxID=3046423 RepID=UPI00293EFBAD|nr:deoxyribodipyrimidine photo-lyase [Gluconobacter sp. GP1]